MRHVRSILQGHVQETCPFFVSGCEKLSDMDVGYPGNKAPSKELPILPFCCSQFRVARSVYSLISNEIVKKLQLIQIM
jgi:hypothetical protein